MNKASLTPSVILKCAIPASSAESFVAGQVYVAVNDSTYQSASPFRHGALLCKILPSVPILFKFTDSGTDQRNSIESVKCASICIFKEMNLDMLVLGRCAPGQSWINPAERVMSILNLGLQNCALERVKLNDAAELQFKKCRSMKDFRAKNLQKDWQESIAPVQAAIKERFSRLALTETPFRCMEPVSDGEIDVLKRHLRELFPALDLAKLQKAHVRKNQAYVDWMGRHTRERTYTFQIRKCEDKGCCLPPKLDREKLIWLPDPELIDGDEEHFMPYHEAVLHDTTEQHLPSLHRKRRGQASAVDQAVAVDPPEDVYPTEGVNPPEDVEPTKAVSTPEAVDLSEAVSTPEAVAQTSAMAQTVDKRTFIYKSQCARSTVSNAGSLDPLFQASTI